jgi:hypothetical protein
MKNFWVTFPPSPKCHKIRVFSIFWSTFLLGEEYLSGAKKGARIRGFRKKDPWCLGVFVEISHPKLS